MIKFGQNIKNKMNINYAELYGVLKNENTFEGAINRWKENGCKVYHITPLFCDMKTIHKMLFV